MVLLSFSIMWISSYFGAIKCEKSFVIDLIQIKIISNVISKVLMAITYGNYWEIRILIFTPSGRCYCISIKNLTNKLSEVFDSVLSFSNRDFLFILDKITYIQSGILFRLENLQVKSHTNRNNYLSTVFVIGI